MKAKKDGTLFLFLIIVALFGYVFPLVSHAAPADPGVSKLIQPNGSVIKVRLKGDEWNNWVETIDGYTVIKGRDAYWYYVLEYAGDKPVVSNIPAHEPPPGLEKHIRPDISFMQEQFEAASEEIFIAAAPYGYFRGPVLFILAEFTDVAGTYTESDFYALLGGTKSIINYFYNASHNNVLLTEASENFGTAHNGIVGWLNLGYPHPNPGNNTNQSNQQITRDAIIAADPFVDFARYDDNSDGFVDADELAVVVVVAGWERAYSPAFGPSVWMHKWFIGTTVGAPIVDGVTVGDYHDGAGGYAQIGEIHQSSVSDAHSATLGGVAHELGHLIFGLPDLYDTDDSSNGIGAFGLMGSGSWGSAYTDTWPGETPVLPCAWSKYNRGWVSAGTGAGVINIVQASSNPSTYGVPCYKGPTSLSNEYFLIENRQPSGYDRGLERWLGTGFGGVAIWHIDDDVTNNADDTHRKVDLEEADGTETVGEATDLWYPGNGHTNFDNTSIPNSRLYNGTSSNVDISGINESGFWIKAVLLYVGDCVLPSIPASITYPSDTCVGNDFGDFVEVSWSEVSDASRYILQRATDASFSDAVIVCSPMSPSITSCSNWLEDARDLYYRVCSFTYSCGSDGWRQGNVMDVEPLNPIPEYIGYTDISCNGEFEVYWQDSAPGGSYYVERSRYSNFNDAVTAYVGSVPSFLEQGLGDGIYYYRVKAENSCGVSDWRTGGYVLVGTPPTPTNLEYPSSDCGGTFRIRWDPYLDSSFTLQRATNSSFSDAVQVYHGSTNWFEETVDEGRYYYRVRAENICGFSNWASGAGIDVIDRDGPQLTSPGLDPSAGTTTTVFRFTVDYYNSYGDPPNYKWVRILNDDYAVQGYYPMSLLSGLPDYGTYYADVSGLAAGSYSYYFVFDEGYGCYTTLGPFDGLNVTGATYYVPDNYATIQNALDSCKSGDTIIVRDGTYTGTGFKNIIFPAKDIILKSENGPARCIIDCEGSGRGFSFTETSYPPPTVTLEGFTIINGDVSTLDQKGGGIFMAGPATTIRNCIVQNCTAGAAGDGGGIYIDGGPPIIIEAVELRGNTANFGGGIHKSNTTLIITDSVIENNTAYNSGGGILNSSNNNDFTAANCIFRGNIAALRGGGLRNAATINSTANALLINCVWYGNSAEEGGGIYNARTTTELKNAILWNNTATVNGTQIYHIQYQTLTISYCDIMEGTAGVYDANVSVSWGAGNISDDPLLQDPDDGDLHLQSTSSCIDTGTSAGAPAADMDKKPRPQDGDGLGAGATGDGSDYDMGPYEYGEYGDADTDGVSDKLDNCPNDYNPSQQDSDGDGLGDVCDNCPAVSNMQQDDTDEDNVGDACDNCPIHYNQDQLDSYPPGGNGIGDACDCEGNFNCDLDQDVDGSDVAIFKVDFGRSPISSDPCTAEMPCNGDFNCDHDCDGTDASRFKQDFGRSSFSNPCPACSPGMVWCQYQ